MKSQVLFWGCTNTQKDPRKLEDPVRSVKSCAEGILEVSVETFHKAIGLWVVGCCPDYIGAEEGHQVGPKL
ncbi:Uncharacterized protein FKW44_020622 [Caligus rogercresseyi]|uniref:Uncharacterized protein n=1 Tax=Caligus rogercresseyi TaxID=217165 RepID=A0A7T8JZ23_CALRO|nr:Uncharacterized protein FKW44_020622 [Caligus rogercresseyi]